VRRHLALLLAAVEGDHLHGVDGQPPVGVDGDAEEARVRVDQPGRVAGAQVVQHRRVIQVGQVGHVLALVILGRIHLRHLLLLQRHRVALARPHRDRVRPHALDLGGDEALARLRDPAALLAVERLRLRLRLLLLGHHEKVERLLHLRIIQIAIQHRHFFSVFSRSTKLAKLFDLWQSIILVSRFLNLDSRIAFAISLLTRGLGLGPRPKLKLKPKVPKKLGPDLGSGAYFKTNKIVGIWVLGGITTQDHIKL